MVFRTLLITLLLVTPQVVFSDIIHIPDDQETIQAGIEAADHGDTVLVDPGRYVETINYRGRNIVVASLYLMTGDQNYIDETIIDADGETRVVTFQNGETDDAVLCGFTLINGSTNYGAGIYFRGSSPIISHVVIASNMAVRVDDRGGYGGGVYCTTGAHPILQSVSIYGNSAEQDRGAIHAYNEGTATLTNCIIYGNEPPELPDGLNATYSDIESGYEGDGNIDEDPLLADPDDGDYYLTLNSPCIDTGDPDSPEDPDGTRADMGVFYFEQIPDIVVDPEELNFGEVNIGMNMTSDLTILNLGAARLQIDDVYITPDDGPFEILNPQVIEDLEGGDDLLLRVRFTPFQIDDAAAVLSIESNDPDEPQLDVALTGVGLPPVPNIQADPSRFDFGETGLYDLSEQVLTITNIGEAELTIFELSIQGDHPDPYSVDFEDDISIEIDGAVDVPITFSPHELRGSQAFLRLECDDPDEGIILFPLTGTGILPEKHFEFSDNTGANHSVLVVEALMEGEPLVVGSEIGIFTPGDLCCGGDYWMGEMNGLAAWGDNEVTEEVDGLREEEAMSFRIWDIATHQEYPGIVDFIEGNAIFQINGISVISLDANVEQGPGFLLRLNPSWNMVSLPIIPNNNDVVEMWEPIVNRDNLELIKDILGRFYSPFWFGFNSIPFWDHLQGYQVKVIARDSLWVEGEFVPEDQMIPLIGGWNMVAYFPDAVIEAPEALANIVEQLEIAKDAAGHFYLPAFGYNDIPPMHRGQGYHIKVSEDCDFIWNIPDELAGYDHSFSPSTRHFKTPQPTSKCMNILVHETSLLQGSCEIGVFSEDGKCVGASLITPGRSTGLAIWGDDPTTDAVDGALEGERLSFRVWRDGIGVELVPGFILGSDQYFTDTYSVINLSTRIAVPDCLTLLDAYPNPFNSTSRLTYYTPEAGPVKLTIHDVNGRELAVLISRSQTAGWHDVVLSGEGLPSGVLFIRLSSSSKVITRKTILLQ